MRMSISLPPDVSAVASCNKGRGRLRWEISWVVVVKLVIILAAGFTVFGAHNRVHVNTENMTDQLIGRKVPSLPAAVPTQNTLP